MLQAYFTELTPDEAYYWMYSKHLAWGYFDHPPIIALLINFGYAIIPNELGVRIIPIVMSTATLILMERLIKPREIQRYFFLFASVGILHFLGFFALPDAPFIFFFALYLLVYRRYIDSPSFQRAIILGVLAALMTLSKYHAIIVIGLTVLSNLKLLKQSWFWLAVVVSMLFITPHLLWQIDHGFPSMKYHLFERSTETYHIRQTVEFLVTQPFILGPLTGILFFIAAAKQQPKNQFERSLTFMFWGGYVFFFTMTFKGRVEGHWTAFIVLPALYLGYSFISNLKLHGPLLNVIFSISLVLVLSTRLLVALNSLPIDHAVFSKLRKSFRNENDMVAIQQIADDQPVAFMNSYKRASLYAFYADDEGFSINNIMGRKNQFDIWNVEEQYRGQDVLMIPNFDSKKFTPIPGLSNPTRYRFIENFQSFSTVKISANEAEYDVLPSETINLTLNFTSLDGAAIDFSANPAYPSYLYYHIFKGDKKISKTKVIKVNNDMMERSIEITVKAPEENGDYGLYFTIKTGWLPASINSRRHVLKVSELKDLDIL